MSEDTEIDARLSRPAPYERLTVEQMLEELPKKDLKNLTVWQNSGTEPVRMELNIRGDIPDPSRPGKRLPGQVVDVAVPPGGRVSLPSIFDQAIHKSQCQEPFCHKASACANPTHPRIIIGGLGLRLSRVGMSESVHPSLLSQSEYAATQFASVTPIRDSAPRNPGETNARLMERARALKAGAR